MIQPRSMLDVADNSGAKKVQCIRVMGGANKRYASLGDVVIVAVKEAVPDGTVKKGEVARAVVVRTVKEVRAPRRLLHPLRPQRGGAAQGRRQPGGHPHLRAGGARAAGQAVHQDHLARSRSHLEDAQWRSRTCGRATRCGGGGQGARQEGQGAARDSREGPGGGRAHQHDQEAPAADPEDPAGRDHRARGVDPPLQRDAGGPAERQADARRNEGAVRRQEGPGRPDGRGEMLDKA